MAESACFNLGRLVLESGAVLEETRLAYRTWGQLNSRGDNAVVVFHSLTGDADISSWWPGLFGPGRAIDPERHFVICANLIGSCYGSTGPTSPNPETGRQWQADFPDVTVRDNVRAQQALCVHLGVKRVELVIGGSLGGMLALQWAAWDSTVRRVVAVASSAAHSAWCIAWSESQRQAIFADPAWNDGFYAPDRPPAAGLAAARMMAMLSYRNPDSFRQRFGREPVAANAANAARPATEVSPETADSSDIGPSRLPGHRSEPTFSVQSYLHHQGRKLVGRFDANSYVCLTRMANSHDLGLDPACGSNPERLDAAPHTRAGASSRVEKGACIEQPVLLVGIPTDILFPMSEIRDLAALLPRATVRALDSVHGHDGFLLDAERLDSIIQDWTASLDAASPSHSHSLKPCIST